MLTTAEAVQEQVRRALEQRTPLRIFAGGTKDRLGRPATALTPLDLSGLEQLVSYEPRELILVVQPGMKLRAVEELLAGENQHLAFEPPHWGEAATIGGAVACNLSGPRRFRAGALRDFILGIEMIDGGGRRICGGGKVVKNVTGYDLPRTLCGSFGTLGPLTELCFKVWPRPAASQTLVVHGLSAAAAVAQMTGLAGRPWEITGLAYACARLLIRVEGPEPAVAAQVGQLQGLLGGEQELLEDASSRTFWRELRELEPLQPEPGEVLWRFSQPPAEAARLQQALKPHGLRRYAIDWSGGLLWGVLPATAPAADLHQLALVHQGLAWRFAASPEDPNEEAFSPLYPGLARLNQQLKNAFDPHGIFNPGRMAA
ncbi:MAG: glycolate oxidase subunit GlcE [Candidatus Handelsmanbacteria bacterium]|nr:glycolate oxidase subunit GlcE [Candidatus Handelsmanbacteria bacterium]